MWDGNKNPEKYFKFKNLLKSIDKSALDEKQKESLKLLKDRIDKLILQKGWDELKLEGDHKSGNDR